MPVPGQGWEDGDRLGHRRTSGATARPSSVPGRRPGCESAGWRSAPGCRHDFSGFAIDVPLAGGHASPAGFLSNAHRLHDRFPAPPAWPVPSPSTDRRARKNPPC